MASASLLRPPPHNNLVVRTLLSVTPEERTQILEDVDYNIFAFPAGLVACDFLSDSGTSAMSDLQWSALIRGDESYGRNWGYYCLLETCRDVFERGSARHYAAHRIITGSVDISFYRDHFLTPHEGGFVNGGPHQLERPNFFIVPQGRCAEFLLFSTLKDMIAEKEQGPPQKVIVSNGFFDTTGANAAAAGFGLETFTQPGLTDAFPEEQIGKSNTFKGNLDIAATDKYLAENEAGKVAMILMTITNNWAAAQPVSMANIRAAADLARRNNIPLFFDACRFAENAWFIREFEEGYADKTIDVIVQEMFTYADGFTISLKKDGLSNMGGILSFRDKGLFATTYEGVGLRLKERQILFYGNDSYGGMSGRDLMTSVVGLYEVTKEPYLRQRIQQVQSLAQKLLGAGIAVLSPPGGHAVFLDMDSFFHGCTNRGPASFPAVGFTLELLKDYGIRAAEAGPFGWEWDHKPPELQAKIPNLVRFAVPRHVFSDVHIDYTVAAVKALYDRRHSLPNAIITRGKNMRLRHFSAALKPIPPTEQGDSSPKTYLDEAKRQLTCLSLALGQTDAELKHLSHALDVSTKGWGHLPIPSGPIDPSSRWVSHLSNDHSPYEYSINLEQETGEAEVRFLIEAQPDDNTLTQLREKALDLTDRIAAEYATVNLDRFNSIRDLFLPAEGQQEQGGHFTMWHSYAVGPSGPQWKMYFNPVAGGAGGAACAVSEAFARVGLSSSWDKISPLLGPQHSVPYFALDVSGDMNWARAKVYISHGANATAADVARMHDAVCPASADGYEIQRFYEVLSGGCRRGFDKKPLLSCFAFTTKEPDRPVGTAHFPISAYAESDKEIQQRVEKYMDSVGVAAEYRRRYRSMVSSVQRGRLDERVGIHSWVSLKQANGGTMSNTFYVSPDLFSQA